MSPARKAELVGGPFDGMSVEPPGKGQAIVTGRLAFDPEHGMVVKHIDRYCEQDGKLVVRRQGTDDA